MDLCVPTGDMATWLLYLEGKCKFLHPGVIFFPWEPEPPKARALPSERAVGRQREGPSICIPSRLGDSGTKTKITGGFLNRAY